MARPKLGLIAGGGQLPLRLAHRARDEGRSLFVIRLKGFAEEPLKAFEGDEAGLAELGRCIALLKKAGCEAICFAGQVDRPDFSQLKPDLRGLKALPGAIKAARQGDDALMRFMVGEFEKEGFTIEGAQAVDGELLLPQGPLGAVAPGPEHVDDIAKALEIARAVGALDIGQGAVVAAGLVLAVEAQEGTDQLLIRCAALPPAIRGDAANRIGVIAKAPKPMQEWRIDLPTIGVSTVEKAAAAGLAGIAGQAGAVLVMDRAGVIAAADRLGLFVVGV